MTAEEIVRRLAAEGPRVDTEGVEVCDRCDREMSPCSKSSRSGADPDGHVYVQVAPGEIKAWCVVYPQTPCGLDPAAHEPDCLWRLAVEWVADLERLVAEEATAKDAAKCPACGHTMEHRPEFAGGCYTCGCAAAPWGSGYPPNYGDYTEARHARERHQHGLASPWPQRVAP